MSKQFQTFRFHQKDNEKIAEAILNDKAILTKWNPLTKNLAEKHRKGKYNSKLAEKAFVRIAIVGCKNLTETKLDFARRMDIAKILEQKFFNLIEGPLVDRVKERQAQELERAVEAEKQDQEREKEREKEDQEREKEKESKQTGECLEMESILDAIDLGPLSIKKAVKNALNSKLVKKLDNRKAKVTAETWQDGIDEDCEDCDDLDDEDQVNEAKPVILWRVNAQGKKVKKAICPKGMSIDDTGKNCKPVGGAVKQARKIAAKKAARARAANPAGVRKATKKRLKALKRRKQLGIRTGSRLGG